MKTKAVVLALGVLAGMDALAIDSSKETLEKIFQAEQKVMGAPSRYGLSAEDIEMYLTYDREFMSKGTAEGLSREVRTRAEAVYAAIHSIIGNLAYPNVKYDLTHGGQQQPAQAAGPQPSGGQAAGSQPSGASLAQQQQARAQVMKQREQAAAQASALAQQQQARAQQMAQREQAAAQASSAAQQRQSRSEQMKQREGKK